MLDELVFYNHWGAGDLFESREFVRELISKFPAKKYAYAHKQHPRMFEDFKNMEYVYLIPEMDMQKPYVKVGNSLYINTWIGQQGEKYVLPNCGCVVSKSYEMFNDTLKELGEAPLSKNYLEYLPIVDYTYVNTYQVESVLNRYRDQKKVLICNGPVYSLQAPNFDFTNIIYYLAKTYPDYLFMVTQELPIQEDNILPTSYLTGMTDGFDLNQISYIATWRTDIIIGRKSGPFCFAHTKYVWHNPKMKSLSFTFSKHASHFVLEDTLPLRKYWSDASIPSEVLNVIQGVIDE